MTDPGKVRHVSDTALWVAMYRAMESARPDALFHDPFAERLAGRRGRAILDGIPKGRTMGWPMVVRTAVMDELILRAITRDGVDTVLNLAAGLDARPYRLPLPPSLRWIDVDLPDMLAYKQAQLAGTEPACALEYVPLDLGDPDARRSLFARAGSQATTALVISEGLLVYLTAEDVAGLARDLHAQRSFGWWLIDLATPGLLKMLEKSWGPIVRAGGAPFRFAPAEGTAFFEPHGWREAEFRSTWRESLRLRRSVPFARLWDLVGRLGPMRNELRRGPGIALLQHAQGVTADAAAAG
jgi:methyltransferase (TIGR00027 family)